MEYFMHAMLVFLYRAWMKICYHLRLRKLFGQKFFDDFDWSCFVCLRRDKASVFGHNMFLDKQDSMKLSIWGFYEPRETMLVKDMIKPGDVVVDLGANIGYFTLIFAHLVGPSGKVYAFEPDPDNFSLLAKNVQTNGYHNVVLVNKAVSDNNGKMTLFLASDNIGDHRIYDPGDGRRSRVDIESVRLDDYLKGHPCVDFIKMDIQGAEPAAFKGMQGVLSASGSVKLMMEFQKELFAQQGSDAKSFFEDLNIQGFKVFSIDARKPWPVEIRSWAEVQARNLRNILCVR